MMTKILLANNELELCDDNLLHHELLTEFLNSTTGKISLINNHKKDAIRLITAIHANAGLEIILLDLYLTLYRKNTHVLQDDDFTQLENLYQPINERNVALKIAQYYYQNIQLPGQIVREIFREYLVYSGKTAFDLQDDFIQRIANTKIMSRSFSLIVWIPDHPQAYLLKKAVFELKFEANPQQAFIELQQMICKKIEKSQGPKLLKFFNRHQQRFLAVKEAILAAKQVSDILNILKNQKKLFNGETMAFLPVELDKRWSTQLVNKNTQCHFYKMIDTLLQEIPVVKSIINYKEAQYANYPKP